MFEFINNDKDRGQVGIGTLIVFIAMVLVAAIAAGVLINTAGFLQSQAEATGQESTDLVSERIEVTSEVGTVGNASAGQLDSIRLSVTGAPGSDQIDLSETTIQAVGPNGQANLVFNDTNANGTDLVGTNIEDLNAYNISEGEFVVASDGVVVGDGSAVLNSDSQFTIIVNPAASPFGSVTDVDTEVNKAAGDGIDYNDEIFGQSDRSSLDVVSPSSATTQVDLRAPDLFTTDGEAVKL
ncbi:archaellin/type IV pilin N-terminal domain-containing protein [Halorubrum sp. N11]|uniref:archaellin/type IV pilin N-terminal domain-containing protein n=1 Tax=Halorubrum sp. N11 TaxID=3402276 RepID=UPI003EB98D00